MRWELLIALDREAGDKLLEEGWEPFGVDAGKVYFRRQVATVDGQTVVL